MKLQSFEYSYQLVMKHALIIMAISIVLALCVGMGIRATALCGNYQNWSTHTSFGSFFTFYVMLYSVIVPLGLAYYIPRKYTRESLKEIDESIQEFSQES
jgi:membrane protein YdbS with pleckstrin-like domain